METENTIKQHSNTKMYTMKWVLIATFLGGPLAGAYMMSKNFEGLGKKDYAKNTLLLGIILTFLTSTLLLLTPESFIDQVPDTLLPIIYTSVIYALFKTYQDQDIKEHLKNNGAKQSGWKAIGVTITAALLLVLCFFVSVFALAMFLPEGMVSWLD